ncbi:unnamed protein product [Ectocarpus sp. 8 AP-2014]
MGGGRTTRATFRQPRLVGEDVVERQKTYALNDPYLRSYLQRRFESERLPLLFAARSSGSAVLRYTVTDPIQMAKKQAGCLPPIT